ncbi:MAG: nitrate reductase associated protein [Elainellaceae cyanobacterium]
MNDFFRFEAEFADSLRCIPMQVRYKLDTCGIKLKLPQWNRFSTEDRYQLLKQPCRTPEEVQSYKSFLQQLIAAKTGEMATELPIDTAPDWQNDATIPDSVQEKAKEVGVCLTLAQWVVLSPIQRFALIKLSRSSHENRNFLPALKEFQVASTYPV